MTQECKLVHGDLSEYNMLYHDGELHIIDVSQSVERDHPQALDFLKRDCVNVNRFFSQRMHRFGIPVKKFFDLLVTKALPDGAATDMEAIDAALERSEEC